MNADKLKKQGPVKFRRTIFLRRDESRSQKIVAVKFTQRRFLVPICLPSYSA